MTLVPFVWDEGFFCLCLHKAIDFLMKIFFDKTYELRLCNELIMLNFKLLF